MRPTVCLAMIVKDEAAGIVETLRSVRDHIDAWCILDTGSTDGTRDLIFDTMLGGPRGVLYAAPFVDFATTRNRALDLARHEQCSWTLMLSGDEIVTDAHLLQAALEEAEACGADAVDMPWSLGDLDFTLPHLIRSESHARFVGVTHEVMRIDERARLRPAAAPSVRRHVRAGEDKRARWELDRELLAAEHARHPDDARTVFYLAQTLECLGLNAAAADLYEKRTTMGGYAEEKYVAALRAGRCCWRLGRPAIYALSKFGHAAKLAPHRAEAWFDLAKYYEEAGALSVALLLAREAASKPMPKNALFVERSVYEGGAQKLYERLASVTALPNDTHAVDAAQA